MRSADHMASRALGAAAITAFALASCAGQAATFANISNFGGPLPFPTSGVALGPTGSLVVSTRGGGVIRLKPPASAGSSWTGSLIYTLPSTATGIGPLVNSVNEQIFGSYDTCHYLFQLSPPASATSGWTAPLIFTDAFDGTNCFVAGAKTGTLFVLKTYSLIDPYVGEPTSFYQAFALTPPASGGSSWAATMIWAYPPQQVFGPPTYVLPASGIGVDGAGNAYLAVTSTSNVNEIIEVSPPAAGASSWTTQTIYTFPLGSRFAQGSLTFDAAGTLYGEAYLGGSPGAWEVYALTPPASAGAPWTRTDLYVFKGGNDGAMPSGGLRVGGAGLLLGTTQAGGSFGAGVAFSLMQPGAGQTKWTETVLHAFDPYFDGAQPTSGVQSGPGGALFGVATTGGTATCRYPSHGCGTVFQLSP
jgi:hypothetical protein